MALKIRLIRKASENVLSQITDNNIEIANNVIIKQKQKIKKNHKRNELENVNYSLKELNFSIKESKDWNKVLYVKCWEKEMYWNWWFYFLLKKSIIIFLLAMRIKSFTDNKYIENHSNINL